MTPRRLRSEARDSRDPLAFFQATVEVAIAANVRVTEGRKYPVSAYRGWHKHTINDLAQVVRSLRRPADMRLFLAGYEAYVLAEGGTHKDPISPSRAAKIAATNLGWCFGEGIDQAQWIAWNRATGIVHPYFGLTRPTPEEAFEIGRKAAEESGRWHTRSDNRVV